MVIVDDNVNILPFTVGMDAIFLCCGVCRGIKLSNSGYGAKEMSSSIYPARDNVNLPSDNIRRQKKLLF